MEDKAFVGIDGRCDSRRGEVMSTMPLDFWNVETGTFQVPVPGNEFVNKGACRFLRSDP